MELDREKRRFRPRGGGGAGDSISEIHPIRLTELARPVSSLARGCTVLPQKKAQTYDTDSDTIATVTGSVAYKSASSSPVPLVCTFSLYLYFVL